MDLENYPLSFDWEEAYRLGSYRNQWDYGSPSQEIATCVALGVFPRNGVLLDAGCGTASDAIFLAGLGFRVKALDWSSIALTLAREKAAKARVNIEFIHSSALKMPIDDSSIDFALDRGLFHNLTDEDGVIYAKELARVLRPGSGFLLRGARVDYNGNFNPITAQRIEKAFPQALFSAGPITPITMVSDAGPLDGAIVLIRRK
jgi:ubiquinone/menaquinone biosynthesis C-methylase UbiE